METKELIWEDREADPEYNFFMRGYVRQIAFTDIGAYGLVQRTSQTGQPVVNEGKWYVWCVDELGLGPYHTVEDAMREANSEYQERLQSKAKC